MQLHYLSAGQGPAVILLHGYAETSRMWRPIIPLLAKKFVAGGAIDFPSESGFVDAATQGWGIYGGSVPGGAAK
jgi:pimeloyl-ACP methyl ester carboxylesterase